MKVLFLSRYKYPHFGGVEKHIDRLTKELTSRGIKVRVISKADINYPEVKLLGLLYIWCWLLMNIKLIKDSDIVHCHDVFIWYLPFRFIFSNKKVFTTFHGYESYPVKLKAKIIRKISEKLSLGNICIGKFMEKWYGTIPTAVSYGATDFPGGARSRIVKYDAIFSGRFDEQTGILTYLDAVNILRQRNDFKFLALGNGNYLNKVRKLAITPGWVKDPEKYLRQSKIAFADRYLAILEAFANKKLVFAVYNNPIKKDYLWMTPYKDWIVITNNSEDLANKILYYRKHKKVANLKIKNAYNWVLNQTWKNMADLYLKLWNK